MNILGLDLSTTSAGWCLNGTCGVVAPKASLPMFDRSREIRTLIAAEGHTAELVVAEAHGTRHVATAYAMGTVHGLVLDYFAEYRPATAIVTVAPAALKRFATGKGGASKSQMVAAAIRCGWDGDGQDDACDAWWLYQMGLYATWADGPVYPGVVGTQYREDVITSIAWPVLK